jgi:hypothetical protein
VLSVSKEGFESMLFNEGRLELLIKQIKVINLIADGFPGGIQ